MNMMLGVSMVTHIFLLHTGVVAHMQDPYSEFYTPMVYTHRLLWFLLIVIHIIELGNILLTSAQWAHLSKVY